jgi:hypothetical protein
MTTIRLSHHDYPEAIKRQIEERLGTATVKVRQVDHQAIEIEFDEWEGPWRYHGSVGRAIRGLQEENEWIISADRVG